ncbi:MAG: SDR family oxidoreductase [Acidimicrobiia bacterium]|nr:SDR family oxidoreductase [Acidimicrobiia bacterium]
MRVLDRFNLDGRVAVIPGGSGAIGSSLAIGLAAAGAKVSVIGRNSDRVEEVVKTVADQGGDALGVTADVTIETDAQRAVDETVASFGQVDIIVNAVGGGAGEVLHHAEAYPQKDWDWIFDLNVRSTLLPTQAAVRAMIEADEGGRVLNISSVRGQLGINAGYSAYVAAKGAVDSLTRQWATEWAKHSITVNAISPTFVDTPQVAMLLDDPDFKAGIINRVPLRRIGETDDLLGAALLFCSDASAFITGQILTIDGGLTATQ